MSRSQAICISVKQVFFLVVLQFRSSVRFQDQYHIYSTYTQVSNRALATHHPKFSEICSCRYFFFSASSNHCLAALYLGAGIEQPFGCLIVQNLQAMQSMGRSMDWTLEDNMVDGLFFCVTLTGRGEEAIPHLCKQEWKRPTPARRRLSRTQALLGRVIPGGWVPVSGIKVRSLVGLSAHSAFH